MSGGTAIPVASASSFLDAAIITQSTAIADYTTPTSATASSALSASMEYVIIAGGGGGGYWSGYPSGGGGGAGGVIIGSVVPSITTYAVTVGGGGGGAGGATSGGDGGNSVFNSQTAIGGGGGGGGWSGNGISGRSGGSGGGAADQGSAGAGTAGQGYSGGGDHGGGGGYSGAGQSSNGDGGAGYTNNWSGSDIIYAKGGGSIYGSYPTTAGSGGQAGSWNNAGATNGRTGLVMIRYVTGAVTATGGTITTVGSYTIHTFTGNGSFVVSATDDGSTTNIYDGNTSTFWKSNTETNPNVYLDFGSNVLLTAIALHYNSTTTETEIRIQHSTNASTWTNLRTITTSDLTASAWNYYRFNVTYSRYLRIYGNSGSSVKLVINEVKGLVKTNASDILGDLGILVISPTDTSLGADGT